MAFRVSVSDNRLLGRKPSHNEVDPNGTWADFQTLISAVIGKGASEQNVMGDGDVERSLKEKYSPDEEAKYLPCKQCRVQLLCACFGRGGACADKGVISHIDDERGIECGDGKGVEVYG